MLGDIVGDDLAGGVDAVLTPDVDGRRAGGTTATWLNAGLTTSPSGCKRVISMGSTVALSPDRGDPVAQLRRNPGDAQPTSPEIGATVCDVNISSIFVGADVC